MDTIQFSRTLCIFIAIRVTNFGTRGGSSSLEMTVQHRAQWTFSMNQVLKYEGPIHLKSYLDSEWQRGSECLG